MLEFDIASLKNDINKLNALIDEYEEIQLNLFNELKNSCLNWQDGNSIEFENKIYLEKVESSSIFRALTDKKEVLNFIYDKYSDLGKKIKCNLNGKNLLIHCIEDCENQINVIINEFNRVDNSFYYWEQQSITNQKNKIIKVKTELSEVKTTIIKTFSNLEEVEREVRKKMKKFEMLKITDFDYNLI